MVTIKWEGIEDSAVKILTYDWNDHVICEGCGQHNTTFYRVDWTTYKGTLCLECYDEMICNPGWFALTSLVERANCELDKPPR